MIRYRPNVALILRRPDGRILICERRDIGGAWQFPQGGVDEGETLEAALEREVREELSLEARDYRVVDSKGPYRYEFSPPREKDGCQGQEQTYFLADFVGEDAQILSSPTTPEFRSACWIHPEDFALGWVASMKRPVYRDVFRDFFGLDLEFAESGGDESPTISSKLAK